MKAKKPYKGSPLTEQVKRLLTNFHNLKGPFTRWSKRTERETVVFESNYKDKRKMRVVLYIDVVRYHKVRVTIRKKSKDPLFDYKFFLAAETQPLERKRIKNIIGPIIKKFIIRNY